MFALTVMYSILFFIIRRQTRKMRSINPSHDFYKSQGTASDVGTAHEVEHWPANLETVKYGTGQNKIVVTTPARIANEERSNPMQRRQDYMAENAKKRMNNVSTTLLCYPIAYLCIIMPITASRIAEFTGAPVPISKTGAISD
jgi:hypothetical protein